MIWKVSLPEAPLPWAPLKDFFTVCPDLCLKVQRRWQLIIPERDWAKPVGKPNKLKQGSFWLFKHLEEDLSLAVQPGQGGLKGTNKAKEINQVQPRSIKLGLLFDSLTQTMHHWKGNPSKLVTNDPCNLKQKITQALAHYRNPQTPAGFASVWVDRKTLGRQRDCINSNYIDVHIYMDWYLYHIYIWYLFIVYTYIIWFDMHISYTVKKNTCFVEGFEANREGQPIKNRSLVGSLRISRESMYNKHLQQ